MGLFDFLKGGSAKSKAMAFYKSGMAKAEKRNAVGAIADYDEAIKIVGVPPDVKAMAIYNRGVAYVAAGEDEKGLQDLNTVIRMDGADKKVKEMASGKLKRMEKRRAVRSKDK